MKSMVGMVVSNKMHKSMVVSIVRLFHNKHYNRYIGDRGRNKGSREVKRFYSSEGTPKEWRTSPTLPYGYPVTGQVQKQIVDALHLGERRRASSLLSHIGYNKPMLIADNFVQILEYCTLAPDPLFAMEIWRTMEEKGVGMNNECHTLIILALCKGGYLEEAFNLMSSYGETPDLYPTLSKYNILLRASAKMRSETHASKCLDLMERDMVGKNEVTYGQLLKFFRKISQQCIASGRSIPDITISTLFL